MHAKATLAGVRVGEGKPFVAARRFAGCGYFLPTVPSIAYSL